MFKKKAQITIFIILGIFVLFFFMLMFRLRSSLLNLTEIPETRSSSESIKRYIDSCMRIYVEETVDVMMKQGGFLYKEDFGMHDKVLVKNFFFPQSNLTVSAGLNSNIPIIYRINKNFKRGNNPTLFSSLNFHEGLFDASRNVPYFGIVNTPKLCLVDGVNGFNNTYSNYTCIPEMYNFGRSDENRTVQYLLERIISTRFISCLEDSFLTTTQNTRIVPEGNFFFIFGDEDVQIMSDWWIRVEDEGKVERIPLSYTYPLRVKKLYQFSYNLLKRESMDIYFQLMRDYNKTDFYDFYFDVQLFNETETGNNHSVLVVRDMNSRINSPSKKYSSVSGLINETNSKNYLTFIAIIENRRPFMDYISDMYITDMGDREYSFRTKVYDPDNSDWDYIRENTLDLEITKVEFFNETLGLHGDWQTLTDGTLKSNFNNNLSRTINGNEIIYEFTPNENSRCHPLDVASITINVNLASSDDQKSFINSTCKAGIFISGHEVLPFINNDKVRCGGNGMCINQFDIVKILQNDTNLNCDSITNDTLKPSCEVMKSGNLSRCNEFVFNFVEDGEIFDVLTENLCKAIINNDPSDCTNDNCTNLYWMHKALTLNDESSCDSISNPTETRTCQLLLGTEDDYNIYASTHDSEVQECITQKNTIVTCVRDKYDAGTITSSSDLTSCVSSGGCNDHNLDCDEIINYYNNVPILTSSTSDTFAKTRYTLNLSATDRKQESDYQNFTITLQPGFTFVYN